MLVSYEITRGIKLVVGRLTEREKGGFGGYRGVNVGQGDSA